jgi:hypothetical protein
VRSAQNAEESTSCTLSMKKRTGQLWHKAGHPRLALSQLCKDVDGRDKARP